MQMKICPSSGKLFLTVPFPGGALDDMSINDLYEGSKSRKSSGFSETQVKSRNCSGMEDSKSRNCSGNSISQGLVSSGFLSSSNPVNIPGSGELTDGFGLLSNMHGAGEHHGDGGYMTGLGSNLGFSSGLFDFGPSHPAQATSNVKDVEICRLREELGAARAKLHSWEESMGQARTACDAWKKEAAMANKKAEMAIKEREVALNKAVQLQKEVNRVEKDRCTFWGIKADGHKHSLHFSNPNVLPPLVGAALRRSSVARAEKDRGLAQLAPCCPQDPRLDPEEGHPGDREGEIQCLKLNNWKAGLTPSFVTGYAGAERAALVDVEQPSVGERSAQPEHPAAEHQRVGLGTQHAAPVQPTHSAPVEPCGEADCSCSTGFSRAGKVQLGALPPPLLAG